MFSDNYSWTELSRSGEQRGSEKAGSISKGSFKWLRSKSLSTSPSASPLRSHIEEKLRENVQSIREQTNSVGFIFLVVVYSYSLNRIQFISLMWKDRIVLMNVVSL